MDQHWRDRSLHKGEIIDSVNLERSLGLCLLSYCNCLLHSHHPQEMVLGGIKTKLVASYDQEWENGQSRSRNKNFQKFPWYNRYLPLQNIKSFIWSQKYNDWNARDLDQRLCFLVGVQRRRWAFPILQIHETNKSKYKCTSHLWKCPQKFDFQLNYWWSN